MNWSLHLDETNKMLILTYEGKNSAKDILDSSYATVMLAKEKDIYKYLVYAQDLIADFKANEIFKLPYELYEEWGMDIATRIAVLKPTDTSTQRMASFYEISSQNMGWQARVFPTKKSALKWLNA